MSTLWEELKKKVEAVATAWASYVALGSFALYLLGYLATRFHLTALGVGTDLSVLDEQYLFAGAKFLVYFVSTATHVLLFALAFAIFVWAAALIIYALYRGAVRRSGGGRRLGGLLGQMVARGAGDFARWWGTPVRLSVTGIFLSVMFIQVVMRKCYDFANLLMAPGLPRTTPDFRGIILTDGKEKALYFGGLMLMTAIVVCLLILARRRLGGNPPATPAARLLTGLLAFLAGVQILFLPVNYGVFIMDKYLPRVSDLGDQATLDPCRQAAWLVWEGSQGVTYLLAEAEAPPGGAPPSEVPPAQAPGEIKPAAVQCTDKGVEATALVNLKRSLVTVPRKDVKRWQIVGYDQIFRRMFAQ